MLLHNIVGGICLPHLPQSASPKRTLRSRVVEQVATLPSALSPLMVAHTLQAYGGTGWSHVFAFLSCVAVVVGWLYSVMLEVEVVDGTELGQGQGKGKGKATHRV